MLTRDSTAELCILFKPKTKKLSPELSDLPVWLERKFEG